MIQGGVFSCLPSLGFDFESEWEHPVKRSICLWCLALFLSLSLSCRQSSFSVSPAPSQHAWLRLSGRGHRRAPSRSASACRTLTSSVCSWSVRLYVTPPSSEVKFITEFRPSWHGVPAQAARPRPSSALPGGSAASRARVLEARSPRSSQVVLHLGPGTC